MEIKSKDIKNKSKFLFVSVFTVVAKNFKTVFRSKSSTFTIIFGPLILMLLLILAFNNNSLYDVHLGVYSTQYSELSNKILGNLETKSYIFTKTNDTAECFNGVKTGQFNACLIFSKNMQISNDANNTIIFYIDPSRINIVYNIMSNINNEVLKSSNTLSLNLTNDLLFALASTKTSLNYRAQMIPIMIANNDKIKDSSNSLKTSADTIDLNINYADFKTTDLFNSIDKINKTYNISSADMLDLVSKFQTVDSTINSTISKTSTAKSKINDLSSGISDLPNIVASNNEQLTNFKSGIDSILSNLSSVSVTNADNIVNPIKTNIQPVESEETHIGRFLPTFLILIIMLVAILLASSLVLSERTSSAYLRNSITVTHLGVFLMGAYLTSLIIIVFHLITISILLSLILGYPIIFLLNAALPLFLITSLFILIGITIGYFSNSQETASVVSLVIIAFAIFFSNTILPIETLPVKIKDIMLYNPFVISEAVLKKMLIFNFTIDKVTGHIISLLWYNGLLIVLS